MAISSEYRLPGVYSQETTGPKLSTTTGGNATVAFVGPALGYRTASQQITLNGIDEETLNNTGVIADSYVVRGRSSGTTYTLDEDYTATQDANGNTKIARKLSTLSTSKTAVSGYTHVFYTAQPSFVLSTQVNGEDAEGYVIKGTLTIKSGSTTYTEDTDYSVDYHTNTVAAKTGGSFVNGSTLTITYDWTTAEPIELVGEAAYGLKHKYISKNSMGESGSEYTCKIVSCKYGENDYGDTPGATDGYIEDVDFEIDYTTGRINRTATSRIPTFDEETGNLFYIEFAYDKIKSGELVVVTYNYVDTTYGEAVWYDSYNELIAELGTPWNSSTGKIQSPISVAAYIATRNGMGGCYAVPVEGQVLDGSDVTYTTAAWENAIEALTVVSGIDIIVPLTGDQNIWQVVETHISTMKENEDERIAIVGADGTDGVVSSDQMIVYAESMATPDIWMVSPSTFKMRNPITSVVEPIAGFYAAAAVAGLNSSLRRYVPLTHKTISGLYSANEYNTKNTKKNQCANGLMYIDENSAGMQILHGRTTSNNSITDRESNIVLTKNYVIKMMREMFSNGYIGSIITSDTLANIRSAVGSALYQLENSNYISDYTEVSATQDASNPTQVNVMFEYAPVYSMNYIEISFSIDGSTTIE